MPENAMVTWWRPVDGYVRSRASAEFQAFLDDDSGGYGGVLHGAGFENIDGSDSDALGFVIMTYQHATTRELMVDMSNVSQGLARVHVSGDHADAFMFTEYLRIVQQVSRTNGGDDLLLIRKALIAFVRHGHGKFTISETGLTKDERDVQIAAHRAREERARKEEQARKAD